MLTLNGQEPEIDLTAAGTWHPTPRQLERFMSGKLPPSEVASIIRHLLKGCPQCVRVTHPLWCLGDRV
jgi:hypothetical protein